MKSCIVLVFLGLATTVVVIIISQGPFWQKHHPELPFILGENSDHPLIKACKTEVGATADDNGTTRAGQCLIACVRKKVGWMNADNSANIEIEKKSLAGMEKEDPDTYKKLVRILDKCKAAEKPDADECVAARNFEVCLTKDNYNNLLMAIGGSSK